jgi:hypothetical protein
LDTDTSSNAGTGWATASSPATAKGNRLPVWLIFPDQDPNYRSATAQARRSVIAVIKWANGSMLY